MVCLRYDLRTAPSPGPHVEWEEPSCLACGGHRPRILIEAPDTQPSTGQLWFAVVQCQMCGLCYTSPRPSEASICQFYPAEYKPHQSDGTHQQQPWWRHYLPWRTASRARTASLGLPDTGRLLDFGCGGGRFLRRMHAQGWDVTGIEPSAPTVARLQREPELNVLAGSLPHPELEPGTFDVITMWQSLEHVHDPLKVLRAAYQLLVPHGKLIVAVPNIESLAFRWFGASWYGLDLPRHLTHFTPWTLKRMLLQAGLQPGPVRMLRHSSWLRHSAEQACLQPSASSWQRLLQTAAPARLASWYCYLRRQSDCILMMASKS